MNAKKLSNDVHYFQSGMAKISELPSTGQRARLNKMRNRLSMIFDYAKENDDYAQNLNSKGKLKPVFITLTYPTNDHWQPTDITNYCNKIKQYARVNWDLSLLIVWVAETTKNGVIHYHIATWIPRQERLPKPSMPQIVNNREYPPMWKYRAKVEGIRSGVFGYLTKYMSKGCTTGGLGVYKDVTYFEGFIRTRGGYEKKTLKSKNKMINAYKIREFIRRVTPRIFGYSGIPKAMRSKISYYMLPTYIRRAFGYIRPTETISRKKGYWERTIQEKIEKYSTPWGGIINVCHALRDTIRIPNNYETFTMEDNLGNTYVGYEFGKNWSVLPEYDPPTEIWIPF